MSGACRMRLVTYCWSLGGLLPLSCVLHLFSCLTSESWSYLLHSARLFSFVFVFLSDGDDELICWGFLNPAWSLIFSLTHLLSFFSHSLDSPSLSSKLVLTEQCFLFSSITCRTSSSEFWTAIAACSVALLSPLSRFLSLLRRSRSSSSWRPLRIRRLISW